MNAMTAVIPVTAIPENAPVAAAEAWAVTPLRVSGIEAVAGSRLLTVTSNSLLVEVASLLSSAHAGLAHTTVAMVRDRFAGPHPGVARLVDRRQRSPGAACHACARRPCQR